MSFRASMASTSSVPNYWMIAHPSRGVSDYLKRLTRAREPKPSERSASSLNGPAILFTFALRQAVPEDSFHPCQPIAERASSARRRAPTYPDETLALTTLPLA